MTRTPAVTRKLTYAEKQQAELYRALAFAATPADEQRMDAVTGEGDGQCCDDDKGE